MDQKNIEDTKMVVQDIKQYLKLPDAPESEPELKRTIGIVTDSFLCVNKSSRISYAEYILSKFKPKLYGNLKFDIARSIVQTALNRAGV